MANHSKPTRLTRLLASDAYTMAAPGGEYAEEFDALLAKYRGDDTRLALAAFTMGAECARAEDWAQRGGDV